MNIGILLKGFIMKKKHKKKIQEMHFLLAKGCMNIGVILDMNFEALLNIWSDKELRQYLGEDLDETLEVCRQKCKKTREAYNA